MPRRLLVALLAAHLLSSLQAVSGGELLWEAVTSFAESEPTEVRLVNGAALRTGPDFLVVTYVSAGHSRTHKLLGTAVEFEVPLLMAGSGMGISNQNFAKFVFMRMFTRLLPPHTIVVFVDAWDVAFTGKVAQIMGAFEALASPLVVSTEKDPFPEVRGTLQRAYRRIYGGNEVWLQRESKYANSGTYVGRADAIGNFMDWTMTSNWTNKGYCRLDYDTGEIGPNDHNEIQCDQACTQLFVLHSGHDVVLDLGQSVFATLMGKTCEDFRWVWDTVLRSWSLRHLEGPFTSHPPVLHGNGPTKWLMHMILLEKERLMLRQSCGTLEGGVPEDGGTRLVFDACCSVCRQ